MFNNSQAGFQAGSQDNSQVQIETKLPLTVAFLLPPEGLRLMCLYRRRLAPCVQRFDDLETAHLTVKYLGYLTETFSEAHALSLIPRMAEALRSFLPVEVAVRGMDMFEPKSSSPVVYMKVLSDETLTTMHEILRRNLGKEIEAFPHADGPNFKPHITLTKNLDMRFYEQVKTILYRSRKSAKRRFRLTDLVLLTPTAIYPIFPKG